jgi:hypothetical protein
MFGYQSAETKHRMMKNLIEKTLNGEKPNGYRVAETYMINHKNWRVEMGNVSKNETAKREDKGMLQTGILMKCERCGQEEFFADKYNRCGAEHDVMNSAWRSVDNKHICPDCVTEYISHMKKFWGSQESED